MTREEAIAFFKDMNECTYGNLEAVEMAIKALEQEPSSSENTNKWIPCSERLPEDSGEYFVTVIDEDVETYKHTGIAWYPHPKDYDVEEGDWRELMIDEKVIAWMPLPKPYKAEMEGEE